jgi:hypothetical protein
MWKESVTPSWQMMMDLTFYFQRSVSRLVRKQKSNMPVTATEEMQFQKRHKRKVLVEEFNRKRGRRRSIRT